MGSIYGSVPKFNDVTDTLTTTAVAGNGGDKLNNMSAIDIGTGPTDRNAQCVALRSLYINYLISVPSFATATSTIAVMATHLFDINWQVLIVLDRQPNKAALTAALIWEAPGNFRSALNLDNRKRIKILKKFSGHISQAAHAQVSNSTSGSDLFGIARGTCQYEKKVFMKFKRPLKIEYDTGATTGVVGDIVDNAISMWLIVDNWSATSATACTLYARTRFISC